MLIIKRKYKLVMENIPIKQKYKKHNKLNRKTKKNKWNRNAKKQIGGASKFPSRRSRTPIRSRSRSRSRTPSSRSRSRSRSRTPSSRNRSRTPSSRSSRSRSRIPIRSDERSHRRSSGSSILGRYERFDGSEKSRFDVHTQPSVSKRNSSGSKKNNKMSGMTDISNISNISDISDISGMIDDYKNHTILEHTFHSIILAIFGINLYIAGKTKLNTNDFFCDAYVLYKSLINVGTLQIKTLNIVFIDVENLIITASKEGPEIDIFKAYNNLKKIIENFATKHGNNYTFILVNHMNTYGDNDLCKKVNTNMFIINANCPKSNQCEKDDFMLILLLNHFKKYKYCSVISHDNYNWYTNGFVRASISTDHKSLLNHIEQPNLVKEFAWSLNVV